MLDEKVVCADFAQTTKHRYLPSKTQTRDVKYYNLDIVLAVDYRINSTNITKQLKLDLEKYNAQYPNIEIRNFKDAHDRFMIIDNIDVYHIGASLKNLGKRWFAFSRFDVESWVGWRDENKSYFIKINLNHVTFVGLITGIMNIHKQIQRII